MDKTVSDVLLDAASYIETNGWMQQGWGPEGVLTNRERWTCACALNAIKRVVEGGDPEPAGVALARYLGLAQEHHAFTVYVGAVAEWNDHKDRTVDDVVDALRGAALYEAVMAA